MLVKPADERDIIHNSQSIKQEMKSDKKTMTKPKIGAIILKIGAYIELKIGAIILKIGA